MNKRDFKKEVFDWAEKIDVEPKEVHIRKMKRKLASCSSRGRLTFATELLEETPEARAYAITHELLHLRYPNHGKMFKSLLKIYLRKTTL